jgi:hypothetical protein
MDDIATILYNIHAAKSSAISAAPGPREVSAAYIKRNLEDAIYRTVDTVSLSPMTEAPFTNVHHIELPTRVYHY